MAASGELREARPILRRGPASRVNEEKISSGEVVPSLQIGEPLAIDFDKLIERLRLYPDTAGVVVGRVLARCHAAERIDMTFGRDKCGKPLGNDRLAGA